MMLKLFNQLFTSLKVNTYNFWNQHENAGKNKFKSIGRINLEDDITKLKEKILSKEEEKKMKIDTLLYIKHMKNTYHKYADKTKFNEELYNKFIENDNFDSGDTAFDDDDNIRIFDRYVIDYIKNRNDILTYLQCNNKSIRIVTKLEDLEDIRSKDTIDILFIIDMSDKDIFAYCYDILKNNTNCITAKAIVLSMVIKINQDYVRIKINSCTSNNIYHPHLVLENYIQDKK